MVVGILYSLYIIKSVQEEISGGTDEVRENKADDLNLKNEILVRFQRLEELIVDFERLDAELSAEESEVVDFEKRYFNLQVQLKEIDSMQLMHLVRLIHKLKDCTNNDLKCSIYQGKHNYLLHEDSNRNSAFLLNVNANCKQDTDNTLEDNVGQQEMSNIELDTVNTTLNSSTSVNNAKCVSFLSTEKFLLYNNEGGSFLFISLLDSGSESSFISENAINILGLSKCNDSFSLSGISGIRAGTPRGSVGLKIGSRFCEDQLTIKAYILNKVTPQIPVERVNIKELGYLESIPIADEDFSRPSECDVILGSDCFFSIL
ncbi:DUF1758 domain-containing protein [Trichonephila inaurata madagascariensis]|uniref:DUF1758 domain-containing protein n=1 Tax=Trichonephila inaurata madagascariensis TaxID=2747483 RepID=A0A8X7BRG3_9ARAC|nr:DUF1758 domain-containing protein [Trichonephila inaurata madagascariensis]